MSQGVNDPETDLSNEGRQNALKSILGSLKQYFQKNIPSWQENAMDDQTKAYAITLRDYVLSDKSP